ncbi:MAG TPA: aryl-sulfate sulfotransferase [Bryobacteraceae bacterium]|nr:aryl-sulfate sulfotransferase [Bryobacteraceae bacterium]
MKVPKIQIGGKGAVILFIFSTCATSLFAQISVSLTTSNPSPAPVGQVVTWTASVNNAGTDNLWYRFRVRTVGKSYHIVRDFGPEPSLDWTAEWEGMYEIELTVRDLTKNRRFTTTTMFEMTPLAPSYTPVVNRTANPLVLLYSAPACPVDSKMRVQITDANGNNQYTPYKACQDSLTVNFYISGLQPNAPYTLTSLTLDRAGNASSGLPITLNTAQPPDNLAQYQVLTGQPTSRDGILLQSTLFLNNATAIASDLNGNIIWYYTGNISFITRPESGGRFFGLYEDQTKDQAHQIVREFDLAGNTLLETNAARVNEQLTALGKRQISGFHHEATRLPNGNIMVLADVEQILTDVQGPGPVDVIGDMIIVMNDDLQVVWTWDAFDHLDTSRMATLNDSCLPGNGCAPYYLAQTANDWLHGNALSRTPDGNLIYSSRAQDWVIKIDYEDGNGSGDVIWRLGKDGDFQIVSDDPNPWFSHQHDPNFETVDSTRLDVFDDGNLRAQTDPSVHSRGQVLQLDEANRVATLVLNADLGAYTFALGSAHRLPNGHYHFDVGWVTGDDPSNPTSRAVEVDPSGNIVFALQADTPEYRSFRMQNLYTP